MCESAIITPLYTSTVNANTDLADCEHVDLYVTSESYLVADRPNKLIPEECGCNFV
jgi:hypothetical protein